MNNRVKAVRSPVDLEIKARFGMFFCNSSDFFKIFRWVKGNSKFYLREFLEKKPEVREFRILSCGIEFCNLLRCDLENK